MSVSKNISKANQETPSEQPLAFRMAPRRLEEVVGQQDLLAPGKLFRRMIEADRLRSIILWGPPGTGKTSLARVIAARSNMKFVKVNAVTSGVAELKGIISDAQNLLLTPQGRVLLFIDEIHRFNKAQQDLLLPQVEDGTLVLIGATTENPFFEVNKALISRSTVFQLQALSTADILILLERAVADPVNGLGRLPLRFEEDCLPRLADLSNGDARQALNALELAALTTPVGEDGAIHISLETIAECIQNRSLAFDSTGESHYDNISAFIKSMRGSDPDAAVFYMARALHGGEDIEFIARRILVAAAEDVGMANPVALQVAMACYDAVRVLGMPEARIPLAEAAIMVATSPKSNAAYVAIDAALDDVRKRRTGDIPLHLRNPVAAGLAKLGYGKGYKYPHDYPGHIVAQQYLPDEIVGTVYYEPSANGYEGKIKTWLEEKRSKAQAQDAHSSNSDHTDKQAQSK